MRETMWNVGDGLSECWRTRDPQTVRRMGRRGRREQEGLIVKNRILYCINHPDCDCAGLFLAHSPSAVTG